MHLCMLESKGETIKINKGVRQGDLLSPKIFSAVLEAIFRNINWERNPNYGFKIDGTILTHLRFADDLVLISNTADALQTS